MRFEILKPDLSIDRIVETDADIVKFGKTPQCEVCLDDPSVSRVHATLEKTDMGYTIVDKLSVGGTYVNDKKVDANKPMDVFHGDNIKIGDVLLRAVFYDDDDEEGEGGHTMAMEVPSLEEMAAGGLEDLFANVQAKEEPKPEDPVKAKPDAPVKVDPPKAEPQKTSATTPAAAKPAATVKPAPGGFGGGFSAPVPSSVGPQKKTIIRKKKRAVSFERRFLSARSKTGRGELEIAMVWRDTVMGIKQYPAKSGNVITAGIDPKCNYLVDTHSGSESLPIVYRSGDVWEIIFNTGYEGFIIDGEKKTEFKNASSAEFKAPSLNQNLKPGSLAARVNGETRAKFVFGEVSILIHYVEPTGFALPFLSGVQLSDYGAFFASLFLHAAFFSLILFSTNRVDALMVDKIMTASRFAVVVEEQVEEKEEEEEKPDEEEVEESEESEESNEVAQNSPVTTNSNSNNGPAMSKAEANAAAQSTGLLAQSNAMNSMLSAGLDVANLDNLDWSSFDSSAAAAAGGYGLGSTGTGGGGAAMGGFGAGGFGAPGGSRGAAITAQANEFGGDLGPKDQARPRLKPQNPEVSGSIDKRIIQKVVRQHTGELRACYERELAKVKGLNGRIVAVWIINTQGSVAKAVIKESTMGNKNVEDCIVNSIKFWRFPAPKGGGMASVEYPFVFDTGG